MQPEHRLIGTILIGLFFITCVCVGLLIVRRMLDLLPPAKLKRLPIIWAVCFLPLGVVFYYLNNFMSDGRTSIPKALIPILAVYSVNMVGWVSSYISRRCGSGV